LHQLTSDLTRRFHTIVIEDLNVRGMLKTTAWPGPLPMQVFASSDGNWTTRSNGAVVWW
jgi:hypothetical protein